MHRLQVVMVLAQHFDVGRLIDRTAVRRKDGVLCCEWAGTVAAALLLLVCTRRVIWDHEAFS